MYTLKSPSLYPGYQLAVSSISGQHSNRFHNSRILANTVPLGFCFGGFSSTAGYAPATRLNLRRAASRPLAGPCLRVPLVFIRVTRESLATFSSRAFRLRLRASMESTAACLFPRSGVTAPIADPFFGLKRRNVRDRMVIRLSPFQIKFSRVLF